MPTIIFNNVNFNSSKSNLLSEEIPLFKRDLAEHIGLCLRQIPPKQLCRCLRDSFMIHFEELACTCPNFKEMVTELSILMSRLDAEEDGRPVT